MDYLIVGINCRVTFDAMSGGAYLISASSENKDSVLKFLRESDVLGSSYSLRV